MCILALAWQLFDDMPLALISNRDEFYQRPSRALMAWADSPIFAGKDLQSGGSWMGVSQTGRWAILTNYRDGREQQSYLTSRGQIIADYLQGEDSPLHYARALQQRQCDYAGFNLLLGTREQAVYMNNRGDAPTLLAAGAYVLSNTGLYEYWDKTARLRKRFTQELLPLLQQKIQQYRLRVPRAYEAKPLALWQGSRSLLSTQQLSLVHALGSDVDVLSTSWDILQDQRQTELQCLPDTGIARDMEQLLSAIFIRSPVYGTRCSNLLLLGHRQGFWLEKQQQGECQGQIKQQNIVFNACVAGHKCV
ncbi:NRDE family protein [Acinetobacter larvae]|uniref:Serine/threonine protein phosphatase n=1 Tax=Acinetobacter larvae TaxID=1789224 RepID=A0A1B2M2K4_9GAMM|nr:NRDE family protein [Acinetobacter larvae]AOA59414.1 serine/threonine protein phosphatase [Acinetobacter larvae]